MSNAAKIAELEKEIAKLKEIDRQFAALPPEHQLAITLHKTLCYHNHTDGCGWEYEYLPNKGGADWNGNAHQRWLLKARKIQAFCKCNSIGVDKAIDLISVIKE